MLTSISRYIFILTHVVIHVIIFNGRYKYYERWATANDFPVENIINDGTTTYDTRSVIYYKDVVLHRKYFSTNR